jgi:hypothetical protein
VLVVVTKVADKPLSTTRATGVNKHTLYKSFVCIRTKEEAPLFARLIKRTDLIFCFLIFDFAVFACVTPGPLIDDDW